MDAFLHIAAFLCNQGAAFLLCEPALRLGRYFTLIDERDKVPPAEGRCLCQSREAIQVAISDERQPEARLVSLMGEGNLPSWIRP